AKTRTILANVFYNMLQSKLEAELTQPEPQDFEIPYESSKRSKSSKWAGSGESETLLRPLALRSSAPVVSYNRQNTNEWKRQIPICLWKVCPAAPWLVNRRR
ncbi:hypothetical protein Bpfe_006769, partial [Biomphalaria pfeifferi]